MAWARAGSGCRLWYETRGAGPDLMCIPGGPGISSRLLGTLGGLDRDCRLVLVDLRGPGRSDVPGTDAYGLADYVSDVEAVRAHLDLARMSLLGHSAGGYVALRYAATYPDRVERLVLVGAAARVAAEHEAIEESMRAGRSQEPWYPEAIAAGNAIAAADLSLGAVEFGTLL